MKLWTLKDVNILVVDDFPAMRSMLRAMLTNFGAINISEARNGEDALELMAEKPFDIVFCDYNLGEGKDGQQVLEEAKEREILAHSCLFIMITAENTSEMVMGAVDYTPDDYLVKPFTKVVLQSRIRKLEDKKSGLKDVSDATSKKDYSRAINLLNDQLKTDVKNRAELLRLKGDLLLLNLDYDAAVTFYEELLDAREVTWAQFGLGKAFYLLQQFDDAREIFSDLTKQNKQFVLAYDWLAKVELAQGNMDKAQQVLSQAVALSPKGIRRQQALAESALKNKDLDAAEKAYRYVVKQGKNSCFSSPSDYGGLARVYVEKDSALSANKVLVSMNSEYRGGSDVTQLQTAMVEGVICQALGQVEKSKAAIEKAMLLHDANPGSITTDQAMEMASVCFSQGDKNHAAELMKYVVRNNHEDLAVLERAKQLFVDNGMAEEGDILIGDTKKEVADINNEGVALVKQGKLKESIRLFQRAVRAMPDNIVINLNVAQSMIMAMQSTGVNDKLMSETRAYLNQVRNLDASNDRYKKLVNRFQDLAKK